MCLRTKKFLFASAFAMQALVFLAATNIEKVKANLSTYEKRRVQHVLRFNYSYFPITNKIY